MTEFNADCTINLHVEARGKPAKYAWSCSISHHTRGRVAQARGFLGMTSREDAELTALLFGLRQVRCLLQEKVVCSATFSLEEWLSEKISAGRDRSPALKWKRKETAEAWSEFRLKRVAKIGVAEAHALREEAEKAYARKRKQED